MATGYSTLKNDWDNKLGSVCTALRNAAEDMQAFAGLVASEPGGYFAGVGYTSGEETLIRQNVNVLNQFINALFGQQTIPVDVDCRTYMAPFTGVN